SRYAHTQYPYPGFSRRRNLIQWRACDGDGWVNYASLRCRVLSNGSAREPCEVSDPLASGWRYAGAIHSELCDSRYLQPLCDGTWYEQCAGSEQCGVQQCRSLLLP